MGSDTRQPDVGQAFGGSWTEQRLAALEAYLKAFATALKKQAFELVYIDAFAGPGWARRRPLADPDLDDDTDYREGSPRRALKVDGFDRYIFIEKGKRASRALEALRDEFPSRAGQIEVLQGDANDEVPRLCEKLNWRRTRGVIYFDPFGLQLAWSTLEAVSRTNLDVWLLFPIGGANRLLTRDGKIEAPLARALDRLLGDSGWHEAMYREDGLQLRLNGQADSLTQKAAWSRLLRYAKDRMNELFAGGVAEPVVQLNSRKAPLFAVFFAVANRDPKAWGLAHKIARDILKDLERPEEVTW